MRTTSQEPQRAAAKTLVWIDASMLQGMHLRASRPVWWCVCAWIGLVCCWVGREVGGRLVSCFGFAWFHLGNLLNNCSFTSCLVCLLALGCWLSCMFGVGFLPPSLPPSLPFFRPSVLPSLLASFLSSFLPFFAFGRVFFSPCLLWRMLVRPIHA